MKRAVSISIGSSKRNKSIEVELLGERVVLERIGTDGDMEKAARLYQELDGKVDAFGVGGAVMGIMVNRKWYVLPNVRSLTKYIHRTPVVDGTGLKMTLEKRAAAYLEQNAPGLARPQHVFLISGVDRYGLMEGFAEAGYEMVIGDLMFTLGISIPMRTTRGLDRLAKTLLPVVGRMPFTWLYPTGEAQEKRTPKYTQYFDWATVIAGDCHYITRYMPEDMHGKVVVTNTTTVEDRELFRRAGVRCLMTTTPMLEDRTFGTNVMEAGIIAALGRQEAVDYAHPGDYFEKIDCAIDQIGLAPQLQEL